ncbi:MAG: Asparagine synthase [Candidatus Parcubacteria bacterium]|jgi:asparagine synthetase B (glutamine-hydrolysing)
MQCIWSYNLEGNHPQTVEELRRFFHTHRNACFGAVYHDTVTDTYYALTDHLGNVPVCYDTANADAPRFSYNPLDILPDTFTEVTVGQYLATGTLKFATTPTGGVVPAGTILSFTRGDSGWNVAVFERYVWQKPTLPNRTVATVETSLDTLLMQAAQRAIPAGAARVSLALSGGSDSAITAYYLKRAGVAVDAFTISPWGVTGSEAVRAQATASRLALDTHVITNLETAQYNQYVSRYRDAYPYPNGTAASLTISVLWNQTTFADAPAVFFAQNADTSFGSVFHQFTTFFYMSVPRVLRRFLRVPYFKPQQSAVQNYIALATLGHTTWWPAGIAGIPEKQTLLQQLSFAGMLWGHTPSDGEVFIAPGIQKGVAVRNVFYDVDLIEYILSIPIWQRIGYSKESRIRVALKKLPLLRLARKKGMLGAYEKKGLVLPKDRDLDAQAFFAKLPKTFMGATIKSENHQFALYALRLYDKTWNG